MLSASTKRTDSTTRGLLQESASRTSSASAGDEEDAFASYEPHGPHRWGQPRSMVCIGVLLVAVSSLAWVAVVRDEPHHHHKKHLRRCIDFIEKGEHVRREFAPTHERHGWIEFFKDGKHVRREYAPTHADHGVVSFFKDGKHVFTEFASTHEYRGWIDRVR